MMGEIAKLTAGSNGALDEAGLHAHRQVVMSEGSEPVISKEPTGRLDHAVTDKALN